MKTSRVVLPWIIGILICAWLLCSKYDAVDLLRETTKPHATTHPSSSVKPAQTVNPDDTSANHNMAKLQQLLYRNNQQLKVIHRADGSRLVRLNGQHQYASAARRQPDGTVLVGCFQHIEPMMTFMDTSSSKSPRTGPTHEVAEK